MRAGQEDMPTMPVQWHYPTYGYGTAKPQYGMVMDPTKCMLTTSKVEDSFKPLCFNIWYFPIRIFKPKDKTKVSLSHLLPCSSVKLKLILIENLQNLCFVRCLE